MARVKRRKRYYFSIAAALALFVAVGVLVALAHLQDIETWKDSPETLAKRLDRLNNAYYTLMDAVKLLPQEPPPLILTDDEGYECEYEPPPGSMGKILGVSRPDDDALLLEYVEKSKPATDLALSALEKPWFLYPPEPASAAEPMGPDQEFILDTPHDGMMKDWKSLRKLVWLLQARALLQPCADEVESDGCLRLVESLRLLRLIDQDGFQLGAVRARLAVDIIKKTRTDHQRRMVDWLDELRSGYSADREFDTHIRDLYGMHLKALPLADTLVSTALNGLLWSQKLFLRRHEPLLRQAAAMTLSEYDKFKAENPVLEKAEHVLSWHYVVPDLPLNNSYVAASTDGVSIALALELFKHDHGSYPDFLDELVPEYVHALPQNPYVGGPFTYARFGDDYALTCAQRRSAHDGKKFILHLPQGQTFDE